MTKQNNEKYRKRRLIRINACKGKTTAYNAPPLNGNSAIPRVTERLKDNQPVKKLLDKVLDYQTEVVKIALRFRD
jgi:hypothetical protein